MGTSWEHHWMGQTTVELWRVLSSHYSDALNESAKAYPKKDCYSVNNWTVPLKVE